MLLDGNERRTDFLSEVVAGWGGRAQIIVVRGRAEEVGRDPRYRGGFELVTARSFGRPSVTVECGAPFLGPRGVMVVSEPPEDGGEARWPDEGLAEVGLIRGSAYRFDGRFGYQTLVMSRETPDRYPRRVGIPTKRPLF
jgi:16S rRNA (guanine527-N7)-methyltransferase